MTQDAFPPLSPAASAFMHQIADSSSAAGPSFSYAASVVLPVTGWAREEFLPRFCSDLALPHNEQALVRAVAKQKEGSFIPFSFSLTAATGEIIHFLALPRPETGKDGETRVVTSLAAQPAQAQQAVGRNNAAPLDRESPIFKLLDVLPAYVVLIDKNHTVRFSNRVARQLFGRIEGKTCYAALRDAKEPCVPCAPFRLFSDNAIKVHDWINTRTNAAFRAHSYPFAAGDGQMYIMQVGINITAGVRARNALDLSEQRYRSIAENLTMGLALVDANFQAITLNPKMEEWFGPSAVKGASIADLLQNTCCDGGDGPALIFAKVVTYKENQEGQFRLALHTGEERHFRIVASPMLTHAKQIRAIVIMLEDITDRLNLTSRIQQFQRLEALGSLAGGIAHEINQPLSALHLYASGMQMLLEQDPHTPSERILERLSLILTQTEKIRLIINHMRALVMQEENPPVTAVNVKEAVDEAMSLVGVQLHDHGVSVSTDIPDDLPFAAANAMQLEQVVINLLVNAMHALDTLEMQEKTVRVTAEAPEEGGVVLRVIDNGPGLGGLRARVFDPFFTTKDSDQGMGLGLSIVH
ncbi:PAS domain S-box protein, partial [Desulfovibrio sp. OttesenSCG-928-O18]|nr:PAS domain S-box protein [Desulfovibrio sp. OttesenSCG-928-O18]